MDFRESKLYALVLLWQKGIGFSHLKNLVENFKTPREAWENYRQHRLLKGEYSVEELLERSLKLLEDLDRMGWDLLSMWDEEYPSLLREIDYPPPVLFYKGDLSLLKENIVAIVGTRKPTSYGEEVTEKIASELAEADIPVVSGLARGIDAVAHKSVIESQGKTIAVLPSPPDRIYPRRHEELAEKIAERGLILSEYLPGSRVFKQNFYLRNRIISGVSKAVIVVEAGERSGALITARYALEQNREVYAVPGSIFSDRSRGTNYLIKMGAVPFLDTEDFLRDLGLQKNFLNIQLPELDDREREVFELIEKDGVHFDALLNMSKKGFGELMDILFNLQIKGYIEETHPNFFRRKV